MNFQNTFQQAEHTSNTMLSCYSYYGDSSAEVSSHCHAYYEIVYIYSGIRNETIDNKAFSITDGTLLFIPPLSIHSQKNKTTVNDLVIQFSEGFLYNACPVLPSSLALCANESGTYILDIANHEKFFSLLGEIKDAVTERDALFPTSKEKKENATMTDRLMFDLKINHLCTELIGELIHDNYLKLVSASTSSTDIQSLNPVISHLLEHPEALPNLTNAAHMAGMSYSHFSRVFQKSTGYSYSHFCNQLRIRRAEELLISTNMSITAISCAIGIDTLPYFTKLFHKYNGLTPSEYRKLYQTNIKKCGPAATLCKNQLS